LIGNNLKAVDGAAAGVWIEPRLGGEFGAVTLQVPKGFEAYGRIFHRARDGGWKPVRWSEVAEAFGTTVHREMQWHAIIGCASADELPSPKWPRDPPTGELDESQLKALCTVLASHTREPAACFFGLCVILGSVEDIVSPDEQPPLLELPLGRDHVVLHGALSAINQVDHAPSLIWPSDHSWCVCSEVDFDSTLVGGSAE